MLPKTLMTAPRRSVSVSPQVDAFMAWLVAMDDPDPTSEGWAWRRSITLNEIIHNAKKARGDDLD